MFSGMLRCADCNRPIVINTSGRHKYYSCSTYKQDGNKACSSHTIRYDILINSVFEDIKYHASLAKIDKNAILSKLLMEDNVGRNSRLTKLEDKVNRISSRENEISRIFTQLYEDRVNGVITENHFLSFRKQYDSELEAIKTHKKELQGALASAEISEKDTSRFIAMIEKYTDIQELDSAIAHELIDRIYIGERVKEGKEIKQDIRIVYKFIGEIL